MRTIGLQVGTSAGSDEASGPKVPTKAEIKSRLDELGVAYKKSANIADLTALVDTAEAEIAAKAAAEAEADKGAGET